jgi:putative Holliday junction resolvase
MPGTPETIMAFDFGLRRIGVAVGQQVTSSASPLGVVGNGENGPDWQQIASLVNEWHPDRLIVGMPTHADGASSEITEVVLRFIDDLGRYELPVEPVDERYTSVEAEEILKSQRAGGLKGRISKEMIDSGAAMLIAERWLKKEYQ